MPVKRKVQGDVGKRLREVRGRLGLTLTRLAEAVGASQSYLSQVETGKRAPSELLIFSIADHLSLSKTWLITGEGEMFEGGHAPPPQQVRGDPRLNDLISFVQAAWLAKDAARQAEFARRILDLVPEAKDWWRQRRGPPPSLDALDPAQRQVLDAAVKAAREALSLAGLPDTAIPDPLVVFQDLFGPLPTRDDLIAWLCDWWSQADDEQRAWLRVHLRRTLPEFAAWLKEAKGQP